MHEQMKKNQEKYAIEDPEQTSLEVGLAAIKIQDMAAKRCATSCLSLSCYTHLMRVLGQTTIPLIGTG